MIRHYWLFALLAMAACSDSGGSQKTLKIQVEQTVSESDKDMIGRAADALFRHCPDLGRYVNDIESAEAAITNLAAHSYQAEKYGWTRMITIEIKIKQDASRIPAEYRAWGHTLRYQLGGGSSPGLTANKDQARLLCGLAPGNDTDAFASIPVLTLIK